MLQGNVFKFFQIDFLLNPYCFIFIHKILEQESEPSLDVDSIIAEVENAENNNDDMGLADENEEDAEENPADLKARCV